MNLEIRSIQNELEELNEYPNCNGCHLECQTPEWNKDGSCPCTCCIIKVMCGDPCEIWEKWGSI